MARSIVGGGSPRQRNILISFAVAAAMALVGYTIAITLAAGSIVSVEPERFATADTKVVTATDGSASDNKYIEFGPSATAPPPTACGQAGGACTAAEVATHSTPEDCWATYQDKYYIITSYLNEHPGGSESFTDEVCGQDMGQFLDGSQGSSGSHAYSHPDSAYEIFESFYVGPLNG